MQLTEAARTLSETRDALTEHTKDAEAETTRLKSIIAQCQSVLNMSADGIDHEKVALAEQIISVRGEYDRAGDERASCINDAIKQLATGQALGPYTDLWRQYFGTKSYDRWYGQRVNCEYGCGPRHGSVIFAVGLTREGLSRKHSDLAPNEVEAAIYYLTNLSRIQAARNAAKAA